MKICIIGHTERNYLPFIDKYIDFFEQNNIDYDVIYWEREESNRDSHPHSIPYYEKAKDGAVNKIFSYLRFKKFVLGTLKKNSYDKLVILTTIPAVFLRKQLHGTYKNRYIFDIRDYSFEKFAPYKKIVDKLIDESQLTTISSHGFMDFLGENKKIVMNHNIPLELKPQKAQSLKEKGLINIGFIGVVRYFDENCALINKLKNIFNYQLWYIGKPINECNLSAFCKEQEITNVSFIDKYTNSQKAELYKNIDIINSIYGDASLEVTTALPNRLYEACILKKPIISSKGTFLGEVIERYNLGMVIDVDKDDVLSIINDYIANFDAEEFNKNCDEFLSDVKVDENTLTRRLQKFIQK